MTMPRVTLPWDEFLSNEEGQDLVEYALMAGLVAIAAGTVIPPIAPSVSAIFSKAISVLEKFS
jgi:pilus assembly protein Flp/PilA